MISLVLYALAVICKANMDIITDHFDTSVYRELNPVFWNHLKGSIGKKVLGYYIDAWHLFNSVRIIFGILALYYFVELSLKLWVTVVVYGLIEILVFNLFYNIILRRKK